jgi:hypothetical protein
MNQIITGISYASRDYISRIKPMTDAGNTCGLFDKFKLFTENDVSNDFKNKYDKVWSMNNRGGGYWIWKPYIISNMLESVNMNDMVVYIDAGCDINITEESVKRFNEYIEIVNNNKSGILRFQLHHKEKDYTNKKTVDFFKNKFNINDEDYLNSRQLIGGIIIVRKTQFSIEFFNKVLEVLNDDAYLFTDIYTLSNEHHRHDQSIMSLLYKYMKGDGIINDETWFDDGCFIGEHSKKYPFWATRKRS